LAPPPTQPPSGVGAGGIGAFLAFVLVVVDEVEDFVLVDADPEPRD
jgi:malate/lactate dehydrogenase